MNNGLIKNYLYHLFLIFNLSCPVILAFYNSSIIIDGEIKGSLNLDSTMISKLLKDRIFILLDTPIENRKGINKKLNDFYNLRSRFLHGDINIDNSINNDILDENASSSLNEIIDSNDIAMSIIISSLQYLIRHDKQELIFKEII